MLTSQLVDLVDFALQRSEDFRQEIISPLLIKLFPNHFELHQIIQRFSYLFEALRVLEALVKNLIRLSLYLTKDFRLQFLELS